jgi:hypothetical protein
MQAHQLATEVAAIPSQSEAIDRCQWAMELIRIEQTLSMIDSMRGPEARELRNWWRARHADLSGRLQAA